MSDFNRFENSEFLIELSEQQQEAVAGGFDLGGFNLDGFELIGFDHLFFQQTEIQTSAARQLNISQTGSASSSESTGYTLLQTTLDLGSPIFIRVGQQQRHQRHHRHHRHHH